MANFVVCDFNSGAPLADLSSYSPAGSDLGAVFTKGTGGYDGTVSSGSDGTIYPTNITNAAIYLASGTPPSADYTVQADFKYFSQIGQFGILGRMTGSGGGPFSGYLLQHRSFFGFQLIRLDSGSGTVLNTIGGELTTGQTATIKMVFSGSTITIFKNGSQVYQTTDSTYSSAGRVGVWGTSAVQSATTGTHIDNLSAFTAGADTTAPVVSSASVNAAGTTLTINFTETGSPPVLPASGVTGFTLTASGGAATLSSTAISSTTYTATISRAIQSGETLTLAYAPGNVTDSAATPNALASFSGTSVTNNSTQGATLTSGTASFVSSGPGGISTSATAATNGSTPYSYQWQRSTTSGSGFSDLAGKTSLAITDATASAGTLYYYRLKTTDNASTVVFSNEVSAQVYSGGVLASGLARIIGG